MQASDDRDEHPEGLAAAERPTASCAASARWSGRGWSPWSIRRLFRRCSMAPVIRPVTSSGELSAMRLSATLRPRRSTMIRSATREDVGHAVADQHDGDALVAQVADEVQHLGHLAHRDRRGRLVHQHDLGVGEHGAGDGDRLALAAGHLLDEVARPGLGLQLARRARRRAGTCRRSRGCGAGRCRCAARGRGRRWRPR